MTNSNASRSALKDTKSEEYTARLQRPTRCLWKRVLNVQAPYQWNLRRLALGRALDVGCGIGRNWRSLGAGSIGTDHNQYSVAICNQNGFEAYTPDIFFNQFRPADTLFDSLLISHVFEHQTSQEDLRTLQEYLPYLRPGGRVVIITPQEAGYASDASHIEFMPFDKVSHIAQRAGLNISRCYSFPFPRLLGRWFKYNEFVVIAEKR